MAYFKASQKTNELHRLREHGIIRGKDTGLKPLDEVFSLVKGYPLFVAGSPGAGKSEFVLELLLNSSVLYGWKHFIYMGENGEVEDIIGELCYKYICKPFKKLSGYAMDEPERIQAEMFVEEHFVFVDDSKDYRLEDFYKEAAEAEKEFGIKFDTTLFDPFNDLIDDSAVMGGSHLWLNKELKYVKKVSKKNKRIDILITHVSDIKPSIDEDTKKAYTRPALPDEWSGGKVWRRRGFNMLLVYVPPAWLKDENGIPYGENKTQIHIQKAKPKGSAKYGAIATLNWNWKYNRYSWTDEGNTERFAFTTNEPKKEVKSEAIKPNLDF